MKAVLSLYCIKRACTVGSYMYYKWVICWCDFFTTAGHILNKLVNSSLISVNFLFNNAALHCFNLMIHTLKNQIICNVLDRWITEKLSWLHKTPSSNAIQVCNMIKPRLTHVLYIFSSSSIKLLFEYWQYSYIKQKALYLELDFWAARNLWLQTVP